MEDPGQSIQEGLEMLRDGIEARGKIISYLAYIVIWTLELFSLFVIATAGYLAHRADWVFLVPAVLGVALLLLYFYLKRSFKNLSTWNA